MTPLPPREEILFQGAAELTGAERARFLDRECGDDTLLKRRLEALLAAHEDSGSLMADASKSLYERLDLGSPGLHEEALGQTIGRFRLLEKIGEGGCGVVYIAEQTEPIRRRVALKVIKLGMDTKQVVARFEAERQALALMDHPNIAKVLDAGTIHTQEPDDSLPAGESPSTRRAEWKAGVTGRPYFVMELVRGVRITEYCDQNHLSTRERLDLFIRVCQAIQHAHQKGIIHRDIKPSNILVALHDGVAVPKVIDFGIAKAIEGRLTEATVCTQLNQFVGTPAYMSPEQAQLGGLDVDTRSDIYSLGVLLYELLTGKPPFDATELLASGVDGMRQIICERAPVRPSTKLASLRNREHAGTSSPCAADSAALIRLLRGDLDWIVMKCLEKDRARRYETANGVAADLKRYLNHEPVVARPPSPAYRIQTSWKRHKLVFAAGAAVTTALIIGLGISTVALFKARSDRARAMIAEHDQALARSKAEAAGQTATRERDRAETELWKSRLSEAKALRFAGGPGARVASAALLHQLSRRTQLGQAQVLALRQEAIGQLALVDIAVPTNWISKQSLYLLGWDAPLERFVRSSGAGALSICEFPSERVVRSFQIPAGATVDQALFTPNAEFLVVHLEHGAGLVRAWEAEGSDEAVLSLEGVDRIEVSPDSHSVLLLTPSGVVVQPLRQTIEARRLQPGRPALAAAFSPDSSQIAVLPADPGGSVEIWDAESGRTRTSFTLDFPPKQLVWQPDGRRLALAGDRGRLALRGVESNRGSAHVTGAVLELHGHQAYVDRLQFTPDGSMLLSYAWDQSSIIWDLVSGRALLRETRLGLSAVSSVGDRLIGLREWPASESVATLLRQTGYRTVAWAGRTRETLGVWISSDQRLAVVGCVSVVTGIEGDCFLWDLARSREIARLKGIWAQFSADSRTLFTFEAFHGNRVNSYDVSPEVLANPPASWHIGREVYRGEPGEKINTGTLAGDGRTLVIAATDAVIFLDIQGERPRQTWAKTAHALSLTDDGRWIATMRHHEQPQLWDRRHGRLIYSVEPFSQIKLSPNSRWFSVATRTTVQIYSLEPLFRAYPAIELEVPGAAPPVAFSPDSEVFAVSLNRTHVRLYETATGRELATLSPPNPAPIKGSEALKFSADGQWLLAARDDGETVAWNLPVIRAELGRLNLDWSLSDAPVGSARASNDADDRSLATATAISAPSVLSESTAVGSADQADRSRLNGAF